MHKFSFFHTFATLILLFNFIIQDKIFKMNSKKFMINSLLDLDDPPVLERQDIYPSEPLNEEMQENLHSDVI